MALFIVELLLESCLELGDWFYTPPALGGAALLAGRSAPAVCRNSRLLGHSLFIRRWRWTAKGAAPPSTGGVSKSVSPENRKNIILCGFSWFSWLPVSLRPRMARLGPLFEPKVPPKKVMWVPFFLLSQEMRLINFFVWGPKSGVLGAGQKVYAEKV